jgi:hypothetical protein
MVTGAWYQWNGTCDVKMPSVRFTIISATKAQHPFSSSAQFICKSSRSLNTPRPYFYSNKQQHERHVIYLLNHKRQKATQKRDAKWYMWIRCPKCCCGQIYVQGDILICFIKVICKYLSYIWERALYLQHVYYTLLPSGEELYVVSIGTM